MQRDYSEFSFPVPIVAAEESSRFYSESVIRKILEHYKGNPAVIGFQIENETFIAGAGVAPGQQIALKPRDLFLIEEK
jgi:hypothetical protein